MKTTYESEYIKSKITPKYYELRSISPGSKLKFNGNSTYKLDFSKPEYTPNPRDVHEATKPHLVSTTLRSSYTKDFISFNAQKQEAFSPIPQLLPTGLFKLSESTTYNSNFVRIKANESPTIKTKSKPSLFIDPNIYLESSHQRDYKKLETIALNKVITPSLIAKNDTVFKAETSNKRDYAGSFSPIKNLPRRLAALNKRN
jgi:hypothetical protein